jgi:hypothetical protein
VRWSIGEGFAATAPCTGNEFIPPSSRPLPSLLLTRSIESTSRSRVAWFALNLFPTARRTPIFQAPSRKVVPENLCSPNFAEKAVVLRRPHVPENPFSATVCTPCFAQFALGGFVTRAAAIAPLAAADARLPTRRPLWRVSPATRLSKTCAQSPHILSFKRSTGQRSPSPNARRMWAQSSNDIRSVNRL